jgi:hypothetical protein
VYKGLWKGSIVAVKTIVLPSAMSGQEKREKMAIMEAAISSALSHPNIMQVCKQCVVSSVINLYKLLQRSIFSARQHSAAHSATTTSCRCAWVAL